MARNANTTITRAGFAALTLCMFAATPAAAIDPEDSSVPRGSNDREILFAPSFEPGPLDTWLALERFHIAKKAGVGYSNKLRFGDRSYKFSVRGPLMKKHKALGLAFRIKF
jgi:hypothetical protein